MRRVRVSVAEMRGYVTTSGREADRLALRWFYQASRLGQVPPAPSNPTLGQAAVTAPVAISVDPELDAYESKREWRGNSVER